MRLQHLLKSYREINSVWVKDINMSIIIKSLEENIGSKLLVLSLGADFLDLTPKAKATGTKINESTLN